MTFFIFISFSCSSINYVLIACSLFVVLFSIIFYSYNLGIKKYDTGVPHITICLEFYLT